MSKTLGTSAVLAVAGLILTGCGAAHPGVAAQVGDETISSNRVDELAGEYCQAVTKQLEGNNQQVPQRYLRAGIVGSLALRSVAEQVAEEYDVEPGPTYDQQVNELEQSVAVLDEEVREAVIEVESSKSYVEAIQAEVGDQLLREDGTTDAKFDDRVARGKQVFEDWIAEHGVEFDPSLGVELDEGAIANVDTGLSYAVSDDASNGAMPQPDPAYSRSLPDAHRCG